MQRLFLTLFLCITSLNLFAQTSRKVYLVNFSSLTGDTPDTATAKITENLSEAMQRAGFTVVQSADDNRKNSQIIALLSQADKEKADILVTGFIRRNSVNDLIVYAQVYAVEKRALIDAMDVIPMSELAEQANLQLADIKTNDSVSIKKLSDKMVLSVRSNPKFNERSEKIQEHVMAHSTISEFFYPRVIEATPGASAGTEAFKLLAEKEETISIVSKRAGTAESASQAAAIVSVFSRRQIEASGARNLVDMLKLVPGVEISYDQFGFYKVAFRGIRNKSGVLMLLDGHRINNFYDGSTFLDIRADLIDKIEIIRGPGSSMHGTNAFVGVINVVTKAPEGKGRQLWLRTRAGFFNTIENSVYYSDNDGDFAWSAHGHVYKSERENFHVPHDSSCSPTAYVSSAGCTLSSIPLPKNKDLKTNDFKNQKNALLDLRFKEKQWLRVNYLGETRGPNVGEISHVTPDSEIKSDAIFVGLGTDEYQFAGVSFQGRLYTDYRKRFDDIQVERADVVDHQGKIPRKRIGYDTSTIGTELLAQKQISQFLIIAGVQYEILSTSDFTISQNFKDIILSTVYTEFSDYDNLPKDQNRSRSIIGVFSQVQWDILRNLSITGGLRYDSTSDFGSAFNPKGGIVYTPLKSPTFGDLILKGLFGTAFRAPTFQEMYDQSQKFVRGGIYGNPKLQPERILTAEAGLEYITPWRPLKFNANGFYNKITMNIEGLNTSGVVPILTDIYTNLRGIETFGYEVESKLNLTPQRWLFVNVSFARSRDFGGFPPFENKDVITDKLDIPQMRGNLGINSDITANFTAFTSLSYSSARAANYRYAFEANTQRRFNLPAYGLWNASVATTPSLFGKFTLRLSAFNILNEKVFDDANLSLNAFSNRSFPVEGRYVEFSLSAEL